jgi:pimeloyl-ACP methyl ester carboxylesterase
MIQYIKNEKEELAGFVAWDSSIGAIVVSFRGTVQSITDWAHNLAFTKTNPFDKYPDVGLHHGFWDSWQNLATPVLAAIQTIQQSHAGAKVVVTGHSLGGAAAVIYAKDFAGGAEVRTYGAPATTDSVGSCSSALTGRRYLHHKDAVGGSVFGAMNGFDHDVKDTFYYHDNSRRRRWKAWQRRRRANNGWHSTSDCRQKSESHLNVGEVIDQHGPPGAYEGLL